MSGDTSGDGEVGLAAGARPDDLLRKVFRRSNDGILIVDPEADVINAANPAACRMLGYDREELLSLGPSDVHPEELDAFRSFVAEVRREGEGWTDRLGCLTAGGERLPAEISASLIEHDGRPQLLVIVRDVTDRVRRRERIDALLRATRRLSRAASFEDVAATTVDIAEEVLEQPLTAFWRYDEAADRLRLVALTGAAERLAGDLGGDAPGLPPDTLEMRVFRDGESRLVEDYGRAPGRATDAPLGTVLMVPVGDYGVVHVGATERREFTREERDLVEILAANAEAALDRAARERRLQERERELERQNERLEEFAGIVAHDLRNPLNVIDGRLDLARETGAPEHFDAVETAVDRMAALIGDTLELAHQGAVIDDPEPVRVDAVAERAWETVDTGPAGLTVGTELRVRADEGRLRELFANLYRNAVEHAGEGVEVRVGTLVEGPGFFVADDGPGIPPDDREAAFEAGHTTAEDGTGFGLAIVEEIAEAHGWTVRATEGGAGGARFEFADVGVAADA
ncbi:MAG: PAS domain-containing sensor histidine kinase [Halobacteriales archaeon]